MLTAPMVMDTYRVEAHLTGLGLAAAACTALVIGLAARGRASTAELVTAGALSFALLCTQGAACEVESLFIAPRCYIDPALHDAMARADLHRAFGLRLLGTSLGLLPLLAALGAVAPRLRTLSAQALRRSLLPLALGGVLLAGLAIIEACTIGTGWLLLLA